MAQVSTEWPVATIRGKACGHDKTYTKINKVTGKVSAVKLCNPYEGPASQKQIAHRTTFGEAQHTISVWMKAGKESKDKEYLRLKTAYLSQHKIGSFRGYLYKVVGADNLPELTGSVTPDSGSQGSDTPPIV